MTWDATKSTGDLITASDENDRTKVIQQGVQSVNVQTQTVSDGNHILMARIDLPANNTMKIHASAIDPAGTSGLNIVARDVTAGTDFYTNNSTYNTGQDLATSPNAGNVIELRVDNSSGNSQDATAMIKYEVSDV